MPVDSAKDLAAYRGQIKEADVLRDCIDLLLGMGWLVIRINQGTATQEATETQARRYIRFATWQSGGWLLPQNHGISDILAIEPGGFLWVIEVKRPGKLANTTRHQRDFAAAVLAAGAMAVVVDSAEMLREVIGKGQPLPVSDNQFTIR